MRRYFRPWTDAEDRRLIDNFHEGDLTIAQIANGLGRPSGSVRHRLGQLRKEGRVGTKDRKGVVHR